MAKGAILGQETNTDELENKFNSYLPLSGGTMSGQLNMNGNKLTNIPNPVNDGDAINLASLKSSNMFTISWFIFHQYPTTSVQIKYNNKVADFYIIGGTTSHSIFNIVNSKIFAGNNIFSTNSLTNIDRSNNILKMCEFTYDGMGNITFTSSSNFGSVYVIGFFRN